MAAQLALSLDNLETVRGEAGMSLVNLVRLNFDTTEVDLLFQSTTGCWCRGLAPLAWRRPPRCSGDSAGDPHPEGRARGDRRRVMRRMVTIGVYGFDGESFLRRLRNADVRLLLDVRPRRGVRAPEYAWANSRRLQAALAEARIGYQHHPELAPTT